MALEDFWRNVVNAAMVRRDGMLPPDVPKLTRENVRQALANNSEWLKPWTVEGLGISDLSFLPEAEQRTFGANVGEFKSLANLAAKRCRWTRELYEIRMHKAQVLEYSKRTQVDTTPITQESELSDQESDQIKQRLAEIATPSFESIIMLLELDRFRDAEAFRLGKQIEARINAEVKLDGLVELRIRTGENLSGDPGVWVWAIVKDEFTRPNDRYKAEAETIRRVIRKASLDVAPDVTPYIAFRSESEIAQTKRENMNRI